MTNDSVQKKKVTMTAIGLGLVAVAIFVAFFLAMASK